MGTDPTLPRPQAKKPAPAPAQKAGLVAQARSYIESTARERLRARVNAAVAEAVERALAKDENKLAIARIVDQAVQDALASLEVQK